QVGVYAVSRLSNGNYVVHTPSWNGFRGALTWGDGSMGVRGVVSEANSLVGSNPDEDVGFGSFAILPNGNYVAGSVHWNGNRGAATWGDGTPGVRGTISEANSLVGSTSGDYVGDVVTALSNGNYVVESSGWNGSRGAVTWGDGGTGVRGVVSEA